MQDFVKFMQNHTSYDDFVTGVKSEEIEGIMADVKEQNAKLIAEELLDVVIANQSIGIDEGEACIDTDEPNALDQIVDVLMEAEL